MNICSFDGCDKPVKLAGICSGHYWQHKSGKPLTPLRPMKPLPTESPEERFWKFVDKNGDCWTWNGSKDTRGYGSFYVNPSRRSVSTHRFSYEIANGPIPAGMYVLHSCDTPSCVNPAHLRVGTPADNMNDKVARNRQAHTNRKLTEDAVRAIRTDPRRHVDIAAQYNVSVALISAVKTRRAWVHVE